MLEKKKSQISVTETWIYQSDTIIQKLVAFAYSVQAGGQQGRQGCWRLAQLPTPTRRHLKYEAKMGEQHSEIKWWGCGEPCSFRSPRGWIFSERLSVIGELLEKGWSSGSQGIGGRHTHTQTHAHLHGLKQELKQHLHRPGLKRHTYRHTQTIHVHKACMLSLLSQFDARCIKCCTCESKLLNDFVYFKHSIACI